MSELHFAFRWRDRGTGERGCDETRINAQHPRSHYGRIRGEGEHCGSREQAENWADSARKSFRKPPAPKVRAPMEGGLPRGSRSYNAIRIKREDQLHWQAPLDWFAASDRLDDIFAK